MEILTGFAALWYASGVIGLVICLMANFISKKHQGKIKRDDLFALAFSAITFPLAGPFLLVTGIQKVKKVINEKL